MKTKKDLEKIIQIAVTAGGENSATEIYGLTSEGCLFACAIGTDGEQGEWRELDLPNMAPKERA